MEHAWKEACTSQHGAFSSSIKLMLRWYEDLKANLQLKWHLTNV